MGTTTVRAHTRRGYPVKSHSRRTSTQHVPDVLQRDLDRMYEELEREGRVPGLHPNNDCRHPGWYPVRRLLIDIPYEASPIVAFCCTDCAESRRADGPEGGGSAATPNRQTST